MLSKYSLITVAKAFGSELQGVYTEPHHREQYLAECKPQVQVTIVLGWVGLCLER